MGLLAFRLPDPLPPAAAECLRHAAVAGGYDLCCTPAKARFRGQLLELERETNESGFLLSPWPVAGYGTPAVLSATLRERPEPYYLLTELARGKLNQVRTQSAEWEGAGMTMEPADRAELRRLTKLFGRAVLEPGNTAADAAAQEALAGAHHLGDRLTNHFSALLLRHRVAELGPPATKLGARLYKAPGPAEGAAYVANFTAARVTPNWAVIEAQEAQQDWTQLDAAVDWAVDAGLDVTIGPIIDLAHGPFPAWLLPWAEDLPTLSAFLCDFLETVVGRYKKKVSGWQVFSGLNHANALGLGEDDRLRLAARLLDAAKQVAGDAPLGVGLTQPWGDYLCGDDFTYSPLVFADTLLRGGASLSWIELELFFGAGQRGARPRSLMDTYRLLDLFALLGVPLDLAVGVPHSPAASHEVPPTWLPGTLNLALGATQVGGVYWDSWHESDPVRVPGSALWPIKGDPAAILGQMGEIRRKSLA